MDRKKYNNYLRETSQMVMPIITEIVESASINVPELKDVLSLLANERYDKPLLKPTLFRLSYELCGGGEFDKYLPFAAACELLNISSYQANTSFDNKLGVLSKAEKDSQVIAAMITRELTSPLIKVLLDRDVELKKLLELSLCLSNSNLYIYKAQHYDLNVLSISNSKKFNMYVLDKEAFLHDYYLRCYYGSGIFSGQVALAGAIAADADEAHRNSLKEFGEIYGTALHRINDLGDFLPGDERNGKTYQDFFCDIRNGRLTYPVYVLYTTHFEKYVEIMGLLNSDAPDYSVIKQLLNDVDVVNGVKRDAKIAYNLAKDALKDIPTSDAKSYLFSMLSVLVSNKFYYRAL